MGGSTDGIMSGLDTPKLEASRQGYSEAGQVIKYEPTETAAELSSANVLAGDVKELFPELQSLRKELIDRERGRGAPGSVSNFLTGFGLNLLSQPGGSNIFQKDPNTCLLYTSPSPRDGLLSRMPSSA